MDVNIVCAFCEKEVLILKRRYKKNENNFCDRSCNMKFQYQSGTRKKAYFGNTVIYEKTKTCIGCGETILSRHTYCSLKCQQDYKWSLKKLKIETEPNGIYFRSIRKYLLEVRGHKCEDCQNTIWKEQPIPLEMDHIDGNHENNSLDNLRLLCPNCHAMTPTYKAKNTGNGRASRRQRYKEGKSY